MSYFNPSFLKFFKELSKNNTTEWFSKNRKTYEEEVKKPFSDFVEEMIKRIQKYEPEVQIAAPDAIMRINKGVRFSKDKTPYNTHVAANISRYGKKDKSYPGFYFRLSPEGIKVYGGAYMVEKDKLQNIRNYIADHLKNFSAAYNDKLFKRKNSAASRENTIKSISPEFEHIAAIEPLIANKQFYFFASLKPAIITANELPDELMEYYVAGKKVNEFLKNAW